MEELISFVVVVYTGILAKVFILSNITALTFTYTCIP